MVSARLARVCDQFVYIPQYGNGTASLNVTVAGAPFPPLRCLGFVSARASTLIPPLPVSMFPNPSVSSPLACFPVKTKNRVANINNAASPRGYQNVCFWRHGVDYFPPYFSIPHFFLFLLFPHNFAIYFSTTGSIVFHHFGIWAQKPVQRSGDRYGVSTQTIKYAPDKIQKIHHAKSALWCRISNPNSSPKWVMFHRFEFPAFF